MKIIVCVRSLNEERNVKRFIESYSWADKILIADGGSEDNTVNIAKKYPRASVRTFDKKININGQTVNPRGAHINWLLDWAWTEHADWMIFDDMDCIPTKVLQEHGRELLESSRHEMVFAYRIFVLGDDRYFPDMNKAGQSLWAWNQGVYIRADESNPLTFTMSIPNCIRMSILPPLALLHYFYPDEETFQRKKSQYMATGEVPEYYDPISQFGKIESLPEWAR